jgi:hypothetical protein
MRWSDIDISFGAHGHPDTELSNWNLSFVVKLPIGRHKVAKTLIDNRASMSLIMRKTFIEEVLMFEVANFNIGYNCFLRKPFLLKLMAVIHTAYITLKMPGWPQGRDHYHGQSAWRLSM